MSAGHRHDGEKAASALADRYYDRAKPLVEACRIDDSYDIPWLANRSRDYKTVYRDKRVPRVLKCGIDTNLSLPWHEIPEGLAMDDGLPYDRDGGEPNAHGDVATPLERREVERQKPDDPDIWSKYTDEMDGYIREVDDETIKRVPADIDLRVFAEDDRKLLEQLIAAGADPHDARAALSGRPMKTGFCMSKILLPSDFAKRAKAGETLDQICGGAGARTAKLVGVSAQASAGADDRSVDFVISTGTVDRYNSTIAVEGWDCAAYERNPVVLWAHDDSIPAIGRATQTRVEGGVLKSRATFCDRDTHPLADTVYRLIKGGYIGAASVGWIPTKWTFVEDKDRGFGIDFLEQELLEWSVVNIPANPDCLKEARSLGIDTKPLIAWAERALDQGGMLMIPRSELEALRKAAGAAIVGRPIRADSADWKCSAARDLAIVEDDSWDGPAAEKAIFSAYGFDGDSPDTAAAAKCFLAHDAAAPTLKGSYKLPFVKITDGKPKASAAGIRAAASRLPQTDIPQAVKDSARKVLDHYEAKMGDAEKNFAAGAAALKTLLRIGSISVDEFSDRLIALARAPATRAGRVLSGDNEKTLRMAHDHCKAALDRCQAACDHIMSVVDQNNPDDCDPDDPDCPDDGTDDDPEQAAAAGRNERAKTAAALKARLLNGASGQAIAAAT